MWNTVVLRQRFGNSEVQTPAISMGDTVMEKQCVQRNEIPDSKVSPIIFCIDRGHPDFKNIKAGRKVTYDLVRSDKGQLYAINIRLAQDEGLAELPNTLTQ
ncbi:hypothetical protein [Pseudomonas sp. UV AK001]|uniref:hypothetical protein n=1 Tax=Pseudomonas sp. UV AK001 TaxID=3384791 RepID=UPI0038D40110